MRTRAVSESCNILLPDCSGGTTGISEILKSDQLPDVAGLLAEGQINSDSLQIAEWLETGPPSGLEDAVVPLSSERRDLLLALLSLSAEQLAVRTLRDFVRDMAQRNDIDPWSIPPEIEAWIIEKAQTIELGEQADAALEKGIRLAARGYLEGAGRILKARLEAQALLELFRLEGERRRQHMRAISRRDRADGLQQIIQRLADADPDITEAELLRALRAMAGSGCIEFINDDEGKIEWHDELHPAGETPLSALKDRLCRAKKKARSHFALTPLARGVHAEMPARRS